MYMYYCSKISVKVIIVILFTKKCSSILSLSCLTDYVGCLFKKYFLDIYIVIQDNQAHKVMLPLILCDAVEGQLLSVFVLRNLQQLKKRTIFGRKKNLYF